ncbi:MAG: DUF6770 family protein [Chitinophagales bacterium]|nr:DUF6770 family protein [Chitinophagales bacterium]
MLAFVLSLCMQVHGQTYTYSDIMRVSLRNSGPIIQDNQVRGYYMFYYVDRVDRKTNAYKLSILDENLKEIASKNLEESKTTILQEGAFDGESILLYFYDTRTKEVTLKSFDKSANLTNTKKMTLTMQPMYVITSYESNEEIETDFVYPLKQKGFVAYTSTKPKSWGYRIDYLPPSGDKTGWTYNSPATESNHASSTFLAADENVIYSSIIKKPSLVSRQMNSYVLGLDAKTGKKVFETQVTDAKYEVSILRGFLDENTGNLLVLGQYYAKGDKEAKAASLGLAYVSYDKTGKQVSAKFLSWADDVSKVLPTNERGKIKDIGYLYFHEMVQTPDGKYYGIAESYRKKASGAGIALKVLAGGGNTGTSVVEMQVGNLYIFRFGKDFSLESAQSFEKTANNVELPDGAEYLSPQLIAKYIAAWGYFDYSFVNPTKDKSTFTVGYTDWEKKKGQKGKLVFGAITAKDGAYTTDKISLETEATRLWISPGKPGYVAISEYNRKAKSLTVRLEKINY